MKKSILTTLLLPLITTFSLSTQAAAATQPPSPPMKHAETTTHSNMASTLSTSAKINLNTADAATLQKELSGIGQTKAEAIVAYRTAHGPFNAVDELLEVNGIGNSLLDRNREKLITQ